MTGTKIMPGRASSRGHVVIRLLGILIVLVWSGVCAADVLNPGFEMTKNVGGRLLPQGWANIDHPSFNSYCKNLWYTEGLQSAGMFNRIGRPVKPGDRQSFYQFVDLTGIGSIEFDVHLIARPQGLFEHFEASFLVDGVVLWSRSADGVYRDQEVDVSNLAGWHRIEFRNTAVEAGTFGAAYWTEWDNFRLIEGPKAIPAVIDLNPGILNPNSNGSWVTCYIELTEGQDVHAIDGATVTLNGIPAYMGQQGWATPLANDENVADFDADGTLERMVKFDRAAVAAAVQPPQATVTVQGRLMNAKVGVLATGASKNSIPFEGAATLGVLTKGGSKK